MDVFLAAGESTSLDPHGDGVLDQTRQVRREFRPVLTPLVAAPADGSQSPCASVISTLEVFDGGGMLVASGIVSDLAPGTVFVLKSPLPEGACAICGRCGSMSPILFLFLFRGGRSGAGLSPEEMARSLQKSGANAWGVSRRVVRSCDLGSKRRCRMKRALTTCSLALLATALGIGLLAEYGWSADPAHGERSKIATEIRADVLKQKLDSGAKVLIIDVRGPDEVKAGSIPGAINIPFDTLPGRIKDIPKNVQVVFTCNSGARSSRAAELLQKNGYQASSYCPLSNWKEHRYNLQVPKQPAPGSLKPGS